MVMTEDNSPEGRALFCDRVLRQYNIQRPEQPPERQSPQLSATPRPKANHLKLTRREFQELERRELELSGVLPKRPVSERLRLPWDRRTP
jgi:hypothetical protein